MVEVLLDVTHAGLVGRLGCRTGLTASPSRGVVMPVTAPADRPCSTAEGPARSFPLTVASLSRSLPVPAVDALGLCLLDPASLAGVVLDVMELLELIEWVLLLT